MNGFNFQGFIMKSTSGQNTNACCAFAFRGFEISISNIGLNNGACPTPIAVFKDDEIVAEFSTVEEAINAVVVADDTGVRVIGTC